MDQACSVRRRYAPTKVRTNGKLGQLTFVKSGELRDTAAWPRPKSAREEAFHAIAGVIVAEHGRKSDFGSINSARKGDPTISKFCAAGRPRNHSGCRAIFLKGAGGPGAPAPG